MLRGRGEGYSRPRVLLSGQLLNLGLLQTDKLLYIAAPSATSSGFPCLDPLRPRVPPVPPEACCPALSRCRHAPLSWSPHSPAQAGLQHSCWWDTPGASPGPSMGQMAGARQGPDPDRLVSVPRCPGGSKSGHSGPLQSLPLRSLPVLQRKETRALTFSEGGPVSTPAPLPYGPALGSSSLASSRATCTRPRDPLSA